ncbi:MAG: WecB/TagA/CpsF family glycosyltransferase [Muribaculaceae bacterium]|nr:WecB/TagA/CpsF family glycosyltransferase [Muribaculaceae bacterium]
MCDSSVVTRAQKDLNYRSIINGAFVNSCDGSSICTLARIFYGDDLVSVNGPEIFEEYIRHPYKQVILGNTIDIVEKVRKKMKSTGLDDDHIEHMDLPFCKVDDFNYQSIADEINKQGYDIIWVSLGNPKQEIFMSRILKYLDKGVMFGIGAALNFYVGEVSLPKAHIGSLKFIWLTRLFEDKRQWKASWDFLKIIPSLYLNERKKARTIQSTEKST